MVTTRSSSIPTGRPGSRRRRRSRPDAGAAPRRTAAAEVRPLPARSLARTYPAKSAGVLALLAAAMAAFLVGIFRPFSTVTKLWFFEEEVSVWSSLVSLRSEEEWFLFWVILVFTVFFPLLKMTALLVLWLKGGLDRERMLGLHRFVGHLGKWSMLDVFIVALLVVYIKSGTLADIEMKDGLVVFTASVLLTQAAGAWIGRVAERHLAD